MLIYPIHAIFVNIQYKFSLKQTNYLNELMHYALVYIIKKTESSKNCFPFIFNIQNNMSNIIFIKPRDSSSPLFLAGDGTPLVTSWHFPQPETAHPLSLRDIPLTGGPQNDSGNYCLNVCHPEHLFLSSWAERRISLVNQYSVLQLYYASRETLHCVQSDSVTLIIVCYFGILNYKIIFIL